MTPAPDSFGWPARASRAARASYRATTIRRVKLQDRSWSVESIARHVDVQAFRQRVAMQRDFENLSDAELAEQLRILRQRQLV